jgi:hypothetical protein
MFRKLISIAAVLPVAAPVSAQVDARMFRQPAVSAEKIAFLSTRETSGWWRNLAARPHD